LQIIQIFCLIVIRKGAAKLLLKFKTQEMRVKPITDLVLKINGRQVEPVKSCTYLGSMMVEL